MVNQIIPDIDLQGGELRVTCGACPTQIEGEVNGKRVYFRHRHGHWYLQYDQKVIADGTFSIGTADGIMDTQMAMRLVETEIQNYLTGSEYLVKEPNK